MKNLIEKIEKALQDTEKLYRHTSEVYNGYLKSHYRGKMEAYMNILESFKDYNIIAVPKSIKLSEIVERLKDFNCYTPEIKIDKHEDATIIEVNYYTYTQCECGGYIQIIDRTICDISFGNHSYHKWLYALWIAGTEIIDDLECDE